MKKSVILAFAILCGAATATYAQKSSVAKTREETANSSKETQTKAQTAQKSPSGTTANGGEGATDTRSRQAQKSTVNDGSTRPGGASNKNANDVGRYSDADNEKSMTHSKKALAERKKNLTEADTVVKKGSGSGSRNAKNLTGKTGNYRNNDAQQSQKPKSDR